MRYLTGEELLIIHSLIIEETGGSHGVRDVSLLASIIAKPKMQFGGKDLYPGVFTKAAVIFESIASYHVFIDGNKRTAIITAARFLNLNGYNLHLDNKTLEDFTLQAVVEKLSIEVIAIWFKKKAKKIK
ncbi:MAG: type II toxin-antitoxin system death-on-curing family toxin [bacterium]|nr:type II toxin-antitoxin system death-on-curing family toxin [bacterium]